MTTDQDREFAARSCLEAVDEFVGEWGEPPVPRLPPPFEDPSTYLMIRGLREAARILQEGIPKSKAD